MHVTIDHRTPTIAEFAAVTAAVGFKRHAPEAVAIGLVEALPLPGLEPFHERFGFTASHRYAPGMCLWLNEVD